ncbi:MAG: hypothetical protein QXN35_05710 [Ignisphaera sp.]
MEIASYLGASIWVVRSALARLRERGIVVETDKGYMLRAELGVIQVSTGVVETVTDVGRAALSILG